MKNVFDLDREIYEILTVLKKLEIEQEGTENVIFMRNEEEKIINEVKLIFQNKNLSHREKCIEYNQILIKLIDNRVAFLLPS